MWASRRGLAYFAAELWGYKFYLDVPGTTEVFDLVFKPAQMFDWQQYERAIRLAPRISYTLQDIIAVRCGYLNSPGQKTLYRHAAELSDRVFTISRASYWDFEAFYGMTVPMTVIYHGSDLGVVGDDLGAVNRCWLWETTSIFTREWRRPSSNWLMHGPLLCSAEIVPKRRRRPPSSSSEKRTSSAAVFKATVSQVQTSRLSQSL